MKVAVYGICKNEEKHVARWLNSVGEADRIFVLDTGSEDATVAMLSENEKVELHTANFIPFRFDIARNMIASQISSDFDIAVWMDFDEVLEPGWRKKLEELPAPYDAVTFRMIFNRSASGEPDTVYNRVMAHRPGAYVWVYPVHEVLVPQDTAVDAVVISNITVEHLPDQEKSRGQYLELLETAVDEYNTDARMRQYLAREYMYNEEWARALIHFEMHVSMKDSSICTAESYRYMARCHNRLGHTQEAERSLLRAIASAPEQREAFAELSNLYSQLGDVEACLAYALTCARIPEVDNHVIRERRYYREWPHHMAAWAYDQLGARDLAIGQITKALNLSPSDPSVIADYVNLTGKMPASLLEQINSGQLSVTSHDSKNDRSSGGDQPEAIHGAESGQAEEVSQTVSSVEPPIPVGEGS